MGLGKMGQMLQTRNPWGMSIHIPALILLQIIFIVLFGLFSRYDPDTAYRNQYKNSHGQGSKEHAHQLISNIYPMFQDVHVMIFIGFGFLMTFLKKYGLAAVSLNMLLSVVCIEWSILVHGFLHPHYDTCADDHHRAARSAGGGGDHGFHYNKHCNPDWPWINITLTTMLSADFATAAVLISFGVLLGTTTPVQLVLMTLIEIVLFNVNEVIGRAYIGAVDAGDTIFVHMFGAYFGLAVSRVLYNRQASSSKKAGANRTSDLFSMVGTVFLWMFWPSFNSGAAAEGDAQMRGLINTYLSLCACAMSAFAVSALVNPQRKFCMEHIQNATLAGGVAVGASADMMLTPFGSIVIGSLAGVISTLGYQFVSPYLQERWKIADTCGVNNLHGMPSVLGGLISVIMAGIATYDMYDPYNSFLDSSDKDNYDPAKSSLHEIFPRDGHSIFNETDQKWYWEGDEEFWGKGGWTASKQAGRQFAAMVITMAFAVVGGLATGLLMKWIAKSQASYKKGATVAHLALNISNVMSYHAHPANLPKEMLFDDNAFFYQEESDDEEDYYKHITPTVPGQKNGTTSVPLEERNGGINNKAYS